MPSPVQSNCDAHDTIANGHYGAVWSMRHTQQVCVRIVLFPSNVWQQFFGRSAFLSQQETDLPPAELWPWQRFQDDENVRYPPTPNEDRCLAITPKRSRPRPSDLSRQLSAATAATVSKQVANRRLGLIGLYARRLLRCVPLTALIVSNG
ncbi:transposable element Tcb1 transposase [Trichonephila clavipes]|nr:transposable element Tcb1 transposase [Trichonephila clavipes]